MLFLLQPRSRKALPWNPERAKREQHPGLSNEGTGWQWVMSALAGVRARRVVLKLILQIPLPPRPPLPKA